MLISTLTRARINYNTLHGEHYTEELSEVLFKPHHQNHKANNPPMKRNARLPPKELTVQFDAFERIFYIVIERQSRFISSDSAIIVHGQTSQSGKERQQSIEGVAYSGKLIKVIPKPELAATKNITASQDDQPLARFHVKTVSDKGDLEITGGFIFEGTFIKVEQKQQNPFPLNAEEDDDDLNSSKARMKMVRQRRPSTPPVLIVSRDDEKEVKSQRYKCGSSKSSDDTFGHADLYAAALMANNTKQAVNDGRMMFAKSGCPQSRKILYVSVVADCGFVQKMAGDIRAIQANIISDFNMVSAIYERAFNIELGLLAIHIMEECFQVTPQRPTNSGEEIWNRPCSEARSMDDRLNAFSLWRGKQSQDAGLFHLVTGCLTNEVVGIAWLNQVCNGRAQSGQKGQEAGEEDTVSGTSISALIRNQFAVIAHEIGHNLGAVHDCTADVCVKCQPGRPCSKCCECGNGCDCQGKFVMSPESGGMNVSGFSDCSKNDICRKMPVLGSCLKEPGTFKSVGKGICGDGIRDEGEECDCGGEEGCRGNPCCTADCKLKPMAQCDDKTDRCCRNCKLIPGEEKKQCSLKSGYCTQPSTCDGRNRDCPKPKTLPDGTKCPDGSQCASGMCTTRDEQCKAIGQRIGLTKSCPATGSSCRMICAGDLDNPMFTTCTAIDADFVDGTPCGFKGFCYKGQCSEGRLVGVLHQYWVLWLIVGVILLLIGGTYLMRMTMSYYRRLRHRPTIVLN